MISLIDQFHHIEDYFFRAISITCWDAKDGCATAYMTGIPTKDLNVAYVKKNIHHLNSLLDAIEQFYQLPSTPFTVIIPDKFDASPTLKNRGYTEIETTIAMGATLSDLPKAPSDDQVSIREMNDNLNAWMLPLISAFKDTFDMTSQYMNAHKRALQQGVQLYHFSLYTNKNDKPISSLTLSVHQNDSRIDDVATLPEFQGQGYATILIRHALREAQKLGASHCFLESSALGLSIYEKVGFSSLFANNIYSLRQLPIYNHFRNFKNQNL